MNFKIFKAIFLSIQFLIFLPVKGQTLIDTASYYESKNAGSVKNISNNEVCIIIHFISGPQNDWKISKKKKILKRDRKALNDLGEELAKYGIDFKFHLEVFNLKNDFKIDSVLDYKKPVEENHYTKANATILWSKNIRSDLPFFKEKKYLGFEGGYLIVMYHEGLGISSASPAFFNGEEDRSIPEYITVFEFDQNWRKPNKYVTVHEMLHLFGAWDLYYNPLYGYEKEEYDLIKKKYPSTIMRSSKLITIDPLTAWRIGIDVPVENWFLELIPRIYSKNHHENKVSDVQ